MKTLLGYGFIIKIESKERKKLYEYIIYLPSHFSLDFKSKYVSSSDFRYSIKTWFGWDFCS